MRPSTYNRYYCPTRLTNNTGYCCFFWFIIYEPTLQSTGALTSPLTGPPFACSAPGFTTAIKALLPVSNPLFSAAWSVHQPPARWSTRTLFRVGIMYKSFLARFAYFVKNRGRGSCQYIFLKVCTAGQPPY